MVPSLKTSRVEAAPPQGNGNRKATGFVAVFQQFCLNTSQHGYKYIALPDRVFAERLVWATAVAAALATSGSLVWLALQQHNARPTLIDIETSHFPVWNFPFPAVTICPTNKVHAQRLRSLLSNWRLPNGTSRQQLWRDAAYVPALLGSHTNSPAALARLAAAISANNLTVDRFMRQIAPQCEKVVIKCQFKGLQRHCQKLFKTVLTEFGVCCSFNNRAARPAAEQRNNVDNLNDVVRMSACGRQMGLSLLIKDDRNQYVTTTEASHGVKVLVHDALNMPAESSPAWLASPGQEVLLSLQPQLMYTTQAARLERPERRRCLLPQERPLRLQRAYSHHNCRHDCRINRTWELCACLPFYVSSTEGKRMCGFLDLQCLQKHREELETEQGDSCSCSPECNSVEYLAEASTGILSLARYPASDHLMDGVNKSSISEVMLIHVFFVDLVGTRYRRDVYSTWRGLLASLGGLLGLCMGVSLLSCFELAYFFTAQPALRAVRNRQMASQR